MPSPLRGPAGGRARVLVTVALAAALAAAGLVVAWPDQERPVRPNATAPAPSATGPAQATAAPTTGVAPGWRRIEPGGRTLCGRRGRYAFWVREGAPDHLLVYFEGGGGCFNYRSCAPGTATFKDRVTGADDPTGRAAGILDLADPANPFRAATMVYVPSCTGDVYSGDSVQTYRSAAGETVTVHHRGRVNAGAAVGWAFEHVSDPKRVFVTGCSAGSVGSALFAPRIIEHWPQAQVTQLGDSLAFVFHRPVDLARDWNGQGVLPDWIPGVRAIPPDRFTMARYYAAVAAHYPDHVFAQVNYFHDRVQRAFYTAVGGAPSGFEGALSASLDEIRAAAPNFRSYLAAGADHCVLPLDRFTTLRAGGVALRDWVTALANGRPVPDVDAVRRP
jgi:hypothetical protein